MTIGYERPTLPFMGSLQYVCAPPYSRLIEYSSPSSLVGLPAGSIILATHASVDAVWQISHSSPAALFVLGLEIGQGISSIELESYRRNGVAAFLVVAPLGPDIGQLVTVARMSARVTPGALAIRLRLFGHVIAPAFELAIEGLAGCQEAWTAKDWAAAIGESVRNIERRCARDWDVPEPRRWLDLIRAIRAVQALQCDAQHSVESTLLGAGFTDPQSARRLLQRVCSASPSSIRCLIGWYFVLERWCARAWNRNACTAPGSGRTAHARVLDSPAPHGSLLRSPPI